MEAATFVSSMFPDADENYVKAVAAATNDNVDLTLSIMLAYQEKCEELSKHTGEPAGEYGFLVEMFPDLDRALVAAVHQVNAVDSDNAVAFLLDLRGQLETLGGPAKAKGGLSKAEKSSARDELWKKYANIVAPGSSPAEPLESINSDGVTQLLSDLAIAADSLTALVLAWLLQEKTMGIITRQEFFDGLERMGCGTVADLRTKLEEVERQVLKDRRRFGELYAFAFDFCRETEAQKIIDLQMAVPMLDICLTKKPECRAHTKRFLEFLKSQKTLKALNRDQWICWLEFSESVPADFAGYDEAHPWPLLFDEFVSWAKESKKATESV